jgi:hypothetical protein
MGVRVPLPEPDKWAYGGTVYAERLKCLELSSWGFESLYAYQIVMKKKTTTSRNGFAIPAKKRKAGEIRSKKDKRKNGKNKQEMFLGETY